MCQNVAQCRNNKQKHDPHLHNQHVLHMLCGQTQCCIHPQSGQSVPAMAGHLPTVVNISSSWVSDTSVKHVDRAPGCCFVESASRPTPARSCFAGMEGHIAASRRLCSTSCCTMRVTSMTATGDVQQQQHNNSHSNSNSHGSSHRHRHRHSNSHSHSYSRSHSKINTPSDSLVLVQAAAAAASGCRGKVAPLSTRLPHMLVDVFYRWSP